MTHHQKTAHPASFPLLGAFALVFVTACANEVSAPSDGMDGLDEIPRGELPNDDSQTPPPTHAPDFWNAQCASCHGHFRGTSSITRGNANGDFRLDAQAAVLRHGDELEDYISEAMPLAGPETCAGECAQVTGLYIRDRVNAGPDLSECETRTEWTYGNRTVKPLTSREYQNSLEDLLGVTSDFGGAVSNNDGKIAGFSNTLDKTLNDTVLDVFANNAAAIAESSVAAGRPFSCADAGTCATRFVDEFLPRVFRGPVSAEQRTAYRELFSVYGTDGLVLALEAALTSPHFLYRIEAGVDLITARELGFYAGGSTSAGSTSGISETVPASQFSAPSSGQLEGDSWLFTENGSVNVSFSESPPPGSTVSVEARGTAHGTIWPELEVTLGGATLGSVSVNTDTFRTYEFQVENAGAALAMRLAFTNDSGEPPYGPGQDANLYIRSVRLEREGETPVQEPTELSESFLDGVEDDAHVLSPFEYASALSFMLTGSTPDTVLLQAAETGALSTTEQIRSQAARLLDSPRGRQQVARFVNEWFSLDSVRSAMRPSVPEFTPAVRDAMVREVEEHFKHVFYETDAPFQEFYGSDYTFANDVLASFYGLDGSFGPEFSQTPADGRGGPIASGAFMAANAHVERTAPILRAVRSREKALCHAVEPPNSPLASDDIDEQRATAQARVEERAAQGAVSSREFYFLYTDGISACASCHETIINPNFGMEDFDNVGRHRATAGPNLVFEEISGEQTPVSIEGTLIGIDSTADPTELSYSGAKDLSNKLAETDAVRSCFVRRSFRFLTGLPVSERDLDTSAAEELRDAQQVSFACEQAELMNALGNSGESPREVFQTLAVNSLVRLRR